MPNYKHEEQIKNMLHKANETNVPFDPAAEYRRDMIRHNSHLIINELAKRIVELKKKYEPNNFTNIEWEIDGAYSRGCSDNGQE